MNIVSSQPRFTFQLMNSPVETSLVNLGVHESISGTFSERVLLAAPLEIKTFDDIIGKESLLTIINNDKLSGNDRYLHGVVRRFEYTGMSGRKFLYEADVVPSVYFLSQRKNCRIFQETTTQEIIRTLLEESGITSDHYRFALENTNRKRGFCVQYQESDLDFISRLMEEEGIYYFFEHYKDKHVLIMSDTLSVHVPITGKQSITCNSGDGLVADKESVSLFTFSQRRTPEAFTHSNFFFKKPGLDLTAKKMDSKEPHYEIYEYAALHTTQAHGEILAKARMEQLVALQKQGHGQSSSCRLIPGYKVTLTGHDSKSLNAEYLIIEVTHSGSQSQSLEENSCGSASYGNSFTVIPAATQFRPSMITPRPIITGLQTAIVVGPKGEEIHTDDHGRVKVQFHWDREGQRNDRSSCWLRVAQAWGGLSRGGQFIPRVGDEVLVDFLEGNPDRPIVTGSVYNGDNQPINSLKKSVTQSGFKTKTHKGDGFHELRFDDAKGREEIFLHSQKNLNVMVLDRKGETISGDSGTVISKNCDLSVGGDSYTIVTGKSTEMAKEIVIAADDKITIVSGGSSIVITPEGIKINNPERVDINDGSSASMPDKRPVTGSTGKSGGGGGRGGKTAGGSSSKKAAKPAVSQQQPTESAPAKDVAPPVDDLQPAALGKNTSGMGDLVSSGSTSPLLSGTGKTGLGDLVSSGTPALGGGKLPTMNDLSALKNETLQEGRNRLTGELAQAKTNFLEKSDIADVQGKMMKLSEKPASLLGDRGIKPDDLKKTF